MGVKKKIEVVGQKKKYMRVPVEENKVTGL